MIPPGTSRAIRVAQLIETLTMGGAERLVVRVAAALQERGLASYIYVIGDEAPLAETVPPGVSTRILRFERSGVGNPLAFAASIWKGRRLISSQLREDRIDVVQSHLPGANFWGLLLQMGGVVDAIPTIHNNREFDYGDADHPLRARFRRSAYRMMIRRCPAVVAVSDLVRDSMADQLGLETGAASRMTVVPNGVDLPGLQSDGIRRSIRKRFGCTEGMLLLLAAGRHVEQKNFRCLIEAAALLRDFGREFRLVIAGDGPLREGHCRRVKELGLEALVELPGVVADLGDVMQAADLFVLPSLWEGLPLVLLEAMAAACPVVATRIEGVVEVITDGRNGWLAEPGDVEGLAEAMMRAMADPAARAALGNSARDHVASRHAFADVAAALHALYESVAH